MKGAIILLALVAVTYAAIDPYDEGQWLLYKKTYGLTFGSNVEDRQRRTIWQEHVIEINDHSMKYARGIVSFDREVNEYIHLTDLEHSIMRNGYKMPTDEAFSTSGESFKATCSGVEIPDSLDWEERGLVGPVKDQGQCGSCWTFSANGALEAQWKKKNGVLHHMSEQNIVDCAGTGILNQLLYGVNGCSGGTMTGAFAYVKKTGGLQHTDTYPYIAAESSCKYKKENSIASLSSHVVLPVNDEAALLCALATVGPISVAIDAGLASFQSYKTGIYNDPACSKTALNHGVLLVGYGVENGQAFWRIKNSWSTKWGDNGYIKIARGENTCGIAKQTCYPVV